MINPNMKDTQTKPGIKTFNGWVYDSYSYFADHRSEMWRDEEMYDGVQWTQEQVRMLKDYLGMQALTINRTFPTINMLLGMQALSKTDISAKGRTDKDTDLSPIASEGLKFVLNQNGGEFKIAEAFKGSIIPGFGALEILKNPDPRKEVIKLSFRKWRNCWWDPYGSPWLETEDTRYFFTQRWVDLHNITGLFPNKKNEIEEYYASAAGDFFSPPFSFGSYEGGIWQEFDEKEEFYRASVWIDKQRKRILPTQMWYTVRENALFATYSDGRCFEIKDDMPVSEQYNLIESSQEVVKAYVPKMRVAIFVGPLLLMDTETPNNHDEFPFAPFVGYTDRYDRPYGVPRQIRDMDIEVNKRRTTALAKLNARRVILEEGSVADIDDLRREATRPDGVVIMRRGFGDKIKIEDHKTDLRGQIELLRDSEREIGEISGGIGEQMGQQTNAVSGIAIDKRQQKGTTITASLFQNQRRSKMRLGYLALTAMQKYWKAEKVVRITDTFQGVDKLIVFNQMIEGKTGKPEMKNSITNIKFDIVVTEDVFSDVMREKYAEILIESTKRAAPEAIPVIIDIAFELLDMPNKQYVLMRLRQAFNLDVPPDEDLTKEEAAEKIQQAKAAKQESEAKIEGLQLEEQELKNEKMLAQIRSLLSQTKVKDRESEKVEVETEMLLADSDREDEELELEKDKLDVEERKMLLEYRAKREATQANKDKPKTGGTTPKKKGEKKDGK